MNSLTPNTFTHPPFSSNLQHASLLPCPQVKSLPCISLRNHEQIEMKFSILHHQICLFPCFCAPSVCGPICGQLFFLCPRYHLSSTEGLFSAVLALLHHQVVFFFPNLHRAMLWHILAFNKLNKSQLLSLIPMQPLFSACVLLTASFL